MSEPVLKRKGWLRRIQSGASWRVRLGRTIVPKSSKSKQGRLMFALLARKESVATYSEIGSFLGLSPPGARSLYARAEAGYAADRGVEEKSTG
jgi:hypothetical protein